MNYKSIILIALVLCLCVTMPVAAVWQNGNWIEDANAPSVQYDPVTGVSSKYVPIVDDKDIMSYTGIVYGNLKSGQVLEGGTRFLVSNDVNPEVVKVLQFGRNGLFDDYWVPGNYTITLPQGTGSAAGIYSDDAGYVGNLHPEVAHITVAAGQPSYFTFIGNSVASPSIEAKDRVITIIKAEYCGETIPGYYTVVEADWIPGHWDGWHYIHGHYNGNCDKSMHNPYNFVVDGQKYDFQYHGRYTYTYHSAITGGCADVRQNIQDVVNMGVTTFKFDNAPATGGIFSLGGDLLSEITDPAPGIEKSVTIQYTVDGAENNINVMEREPITL